MFRQYHGQSPYWVIGMNAGEPWTAVAQTNVGIQIVPCHSNADRAREVVGKWQAQAQARGQIAPGVAVAGACVVDPVGRASSSWGRAPRPGGTSLWVPLMRLRMEQPVTCLECQAWRWQGCWVAVDMRGCSQCLPAAEAADPRVWPDEPQRPALEDVAPSPKPRVQRPRSTAGRPAGRRPVTTVALPGQSRIA